MGEPRERGEEENARGSVRGSRQGYKSLLQTGTTRPGVVISGSVLTSDEAENAPRLRVTYGEDSKESGPPLTRRVETHTASAQDTSTPVPWRWRSRGARLRGSHRPRSVGPLRATHSLSRRREKSFPRCAAQMDWEYWKRWNRFRKTPSS